MTRRCGRKWSRRRRTSCPVGAPFRAAPACSNCLAPCRARRKVRTGECACPPRRSPTPAWRRAATGSREALFSTNRPMIVHRRTRRRWHGEDAATVSPPRSSTPTMIWSLRRTPNHRPTPCSRRDFIADISHELRTPLAVLRGELEAIEDGVHAFDRHSLASLQNEVAMLNKLIEDLYELSLSDVGALSYRKVPADVGQLVHASVESMRESFRAKQIALSLTLPEASYESPADGAASLIFQVDPARFVQLLKNLLLNSLP